VRNLVQKKIINGLSDETKKGFELERNAHQFLWDLGYLVFPRRKLYAIRYKFGNYGESIDKMMVTDLDTFGILFGRFLEKKTFLIDCKHRSEQIFSQILRSKGISTILEINFLLILRESVPETVQQFADNFSIRLQAISSFEKAIKKREKGSFSLKSYIKIHELLKFQNKTTKEFTMKLSNSFLEENPFQRIKLLRIVYNDLKNHISSINENHQKDLSKYILLQTFQYSLIAIADMASQTIHLSEYHFKDYISLKLIGNIEFKRELFAKIRAIEEGIEVKNDEINLLKELSPTYSDQVKELVNQFRKKPHYVQKYLRFVDFIIHEYYLFNEKLEEKDLINELEEIDRELFGKWNIKCLEILDDEKKYPLFLSELLA